MFGRGIHLFTVFGFSVRLDPSYANAFGSRAFVYLKLGQFDRALADYTAAVQLNPNDAYSLYSRGLAMRALGKEEEAKVDIARAKEIEPGIGP